MIRRAFLDLAHGQLHYRTLGAPDAPPLLMLHSGPGASQSLQPLMRPMSHGRRVFACDIPGFGDSAPLPIEAPAIADFAAALIPALDALGLAQVDLYGTHTGANICVEMALLAPARVRRVVLDGIALYSPQQRQELLATYARRITPDQGGTHLLKVWHFVRDQQLFFPWFRRQDARHLRGLGLPDAAVVHDLVVEVLRGMTTYHRGYNASFAYVKEERLPLLRVPTMVASSPSDLFFPELDRIVALIPGATRMVTPEYGVQGAVEKAAAMFLGYLAA